MGFLFQLIFPSAGGVVFSAQIFGNRFWGAGAPTRWILFILLSVSPHQIQPILARAAVEFMLRWYLVSVSFLSG